MNNNRDFCGYLEVCKDFIVFVYKYIDETEFYI